MNASDKVKLTQYSHGAGCGCKIAPDVLEKVLATGNDISHFPPPSYNHYRMSRCELLVLPFTHKSCSPRAWVSPSLTALPFQLSWASPGEALLSSRGRPPQAAEKGTLPR